jgi:hypothetical protein
VQVFGRIGVFTPVEHEFGSGLRAHLGRRTSVGAQASLPESGPLAAAPAQERGLCEPGPAQERGLAEARPSVPAPPTVPSGPTLDERIDALAAAEAELSFRERRVGERETSFNVAVQRVVYQLAQEMLEGEITALPRDELAVARARRGGRAA